MEGADLASERASDSNWFRLGVLWAESERGPKMIVARQIAARKYSRVWIESGMELGFYSRDGERNRFPEV